MNFLITELENGANAREQLIKLSEAMRTGEITLSNEEMAELAGRLCECLTNEDAKARKNAAKLLGNLQGAGIADALMQAYRNETVQFVKSQYLESLSHFQTEPYQQELLDWKRKLMEQEPEESMRKHVNQELRALNLCLQDGAYAGHTFVGYEKEADVLLSCPAEVSELLYQQIKEPVKKKAKNGVLVRTKLLKEVLSSRIYRDVYFILPKQKEVNGDAYQIAKQLAGGELLHFLNARHSGEGAYRYRIELRSKMDDKKKGMFLKRLAGELDRISGQQFANSAEEYEIELRLIEREPDQYRLLVCLYTLKDTRFLYRREHVAASIHPSDAAAGMQLLQPYVKEDAQVLDPFCGVGTLIYERAMLSEFQAAFGIDTYGEAIEKAKRNLASLGERVHLIHKNCFDFQHARKFDEIITNMPFTAKEDQTPIIECYRNFFRKMPGLMQEHGVMLLFSHDGKLVEQYANDAFHILRSCMLRDQHALDVYVLQKK